MNNLIQPKRSLASLIIGACALSLTACSSMGSSGPSGSSLSMATSRNLGNGRIEIVELTNTVATRVSASMRTAQFADVLGEGAPIGTIIGRGDVLDITIWEAPPAALFGTVVADNRFSSNTALARSSGFPEQMVDSSGKIRIPFAGLISVAGLTPNQIELEIVGRLQGKANNPQVIVRLARNANANVTVIGDVLSSARVPLSPKGERLLDVLASAGGVKQSVDKTMIQVTRGERVTSMPLEALIKDPRQNIRMQPDDVITALYQPFSFTALGAIANNAEINFEGTGLTLAQALGRVGGLRDDRADIRGVFIFRLEDPSALDPILTDRVQKTLDGKVPIIYRVDLKDPASFFLAQGFPIRNKDVLYVSNAPGADIQKFVNLVSQTAFSIISIGNSVN